MGDKNSPYYPIWSKMRNMMMVHYKGHRVHIVCGSISETVEIKDANTDISIAKALNQLRRKYGDDAFLNNKAYIDFHPFAYIVIEPDTTIDKMTQKVTICQ